MKQISSNGILAIKTVCFILGLLISISLCTLLIGILPHGSKLLTPLCGLSGVVGSIIGTISNKLINNHIK